DGIRDRNVTGVQTLCSSDLVRLRVRDTVDLSKSTILDIVKHWVILPECGVEYQDGARPRVRIGFASVAEALIHYQFPPDEQLSEIGRASCREREYQWGVEGG